MNTVIRVVQELQKLGVKSAIAIYDLQYHLTILKYSILSRQTLFGE